jgi:hypothetical protein
VVARPRPTDPKTPLHPRIPKIKVDRADPAHQIR